MNHCAIGLEHKLRALADFALHQNVNSTNASGSAQTAYRFGLPSFLCHLIDLRYKFPNLASIEEDFILLHSNHLQAVLYIGFSQLLSTIF